MRDSALPGPAYAATRVLIASTFVVMGAWRLWHAVQGVPTTGATLTFSAFELLLGLAIAAGLKVRPLAVVSALLLVVDAVLSHPFWSLAEPDRSAQLLHFMKNAGLVGGFLLLAVVAPRRRR